MTKCTTTQGLVLPARSEQSAGLYSRVFCGLPVPFSLHSFWHLEVAYNEPSLGHVSQSWKVIKKRKKRKNWPSYNTTNLKGQYRMPGFYSFLYLHISTTPKGAHLCPLSIALTGPCRGLGFIYTKGKNLEKYCSNYFFFSTIRLKIPCGHDSDVSLLTKSKNKIRKNKKLPYQYFPKFHRIFFTL